MSADEEGEWHYNHNLKGDPAFLPRVGWMSAVMRGHAAVAAGLGIEVPVLMLISNRSDPSRTWNDDMHRADLVLDVDARMISSLRAFGPDVVWPLVHGGPGEDGGLQNVLIALGLPYVGTHSDGCQRASFKPTAKAMVRTGGVLTPDSVTLPKTYFSQLGAQEVLGVVAAHLDLPVVVKPNQGGSGLGVSLAEDADELRSAMVACFAYDERALIESYVPGREIAVSVVDTGDGPRPLPPVEVVTDGEYDFDARYNPGRSEYFVPARLTAAEFALVQETAMTVHRTLGLGNLSRTDLILDDAGTPWFIDVNVVPGMTETSLLPLAAEAEGGLPELYDALVRHPLVTPS